ncbi:sulfite exporter TauE/SafE family protein [Nocardioides piscis]|uniref:Probable membrane transporter protein n=1 Tax=Nocardioides piscis TaxID=2714938 RepID=A0A6G7YH75_9ACTN|nr:sulfite exporter TauE/SafE family protein [Nocardioides piscis]QIK76162.1 sulfite exporter TauE/SafE family protein [Nocardioides piscis]
MTDLLLLAVVATAVFVLAALAQAITGFGSALVAVPLLTLVVEPVAAVVAATAVSLVLTSGAAWQERRFVDRDAATTLVWTGVLGMPVGLLVLGIVDEERLQAWIAVVLLALVVLVAFGVRTGTRSLPVAGVVSGALLTSTGMNGPPLVMALVDREPRRYRATLQAVFAAQDVVAVAAFLALGHVSLEAAVLTAGGILGLPLGWRVGDVLFHRVSPARLRPLVIGGLVLTAVSMLVGAVT